MATFENSNMDKNEVFSKAVKAGKRTYFFDVKATKGNDFYLTVTESKKVNDANGNIFFEKHKVFLYREDFDKFMAVMNETIEFVDKCVKENQSKGIKTIRDIQFDDL